MCTSGDEHGKAFLNSNCTSVIIDFAPEYTANARSNFIDSFIDASKCCVVDTYRPIDTGYDANQIVTTIVLDITDDTAYLRMLINL
jgi:hypothetical protein